MTVSAWFRLYPKHLIRPAIGFAAALAVAAVLPSSISLSHDGATGEVRQRMNEMDAFAAAVKKLVPMIRQPGFWDSEKVADQAATIETRAGTHLLRLFPEGSDRPPSEAAPLIWFEWERFSGLAETLRRSAAALRNSAELASAPDDGSGGISPETAFTEIVGTCRACHKTYRQRR